MVSPFLSGMAGAILAPLLPEFVLNKLLDSLLEYLSRDQPSSSSDVDNKLQQLDNERKAFSEANRKLEIIQGEARKFLGRDKQNMRLIHIDNKLRDVRYEIQDLKDDLEYMEVQRKVEEINLQDEAEKNPSRTRELWSWIPWTTGQSSNKRRRLSSSESTDDIVNQMRIIIEQINHIDLEMKEIKMHARSDIEITFKGCYDSCGRHEIAESNRVTTSSPTESKIYGRDYQFRQLIEMLREPKERGNVSVVPIVGMGGIGKTSLAQFVFNCREIANHFHKKAWICVSDHFERLRITKEILDSLSVGDGRSSTFSFGVTTSLDVLEREIKRHVTGKKFLLVLDDVWSDEWQQLLNFLRTAKAEAVKLIVTCRDPKISGVLANGRNQITLKGLSDEAYWEFFKKCAFGDSDNYPQQLHAIGKQIMGKLKGSPLAAKTVGRLLGSRLTEEHWKDILESDLWKLDTDAHGIMSALALSYHHLRQPLQLCFTFCSVFPKDFVYDRHSVVGMWIAQGYIQEVEGSSKTLEDIGEEYWHELEARGFFENFFRMHHFKMHDLLHDLAQSVSHMETYIYKGRKNEEIPKDVRHLCALSSFDLELVRKTNNLRTLVLYGAGDMHAILNHRAFKRIRVLIIFSSDVQEIPDDIAHLKYLQYLDLEKTNIKSIPESLCGLYLLRVLKLLRAPPTLPSRFHNLISLRSFCKFDDRLMDFSETSYRVIREGGYQIAQLRNMNELRGELLIGGLESIDNMEEVMKAKYLKEKRHIKELQLRWKHAVDGCKHDVQQQVLEALQPHPNLKCLRIVGYMGSKSPSWLVTGALQNLQRLGLYECRNWASLPAALGLLPSLETLELIGIENMAIEGDDSVTEMYPSLQSLDLTESTLSFEGLSASASSSSSSLTTPGRCKWFPRLRSLEVCNCDRVSGFPWPMLAALDRLKIIDSLGLHGQVPSCLQNLNSLSELYITGLKVETSGIGAQQLQYLLPNLKVIEIVRCENMAFLQALFLGVNSLERLTICKCGPVYLPALGHLSFLGRISLTEVKVTVEDITRVFPSLYILELKDASMKVTVKGDTRVFPSLHTLQLKKASLVFQKNTSSSSWSSSVVTTQNRNHFPKLATLTIEGCDEVNGLCWPLCSALKELKITDSPGLDDQLPGCLNGFSSLLKLSMTGAKIQAFPAKVMTTLHALERLYVCLCDELTSLEGLQALRSLKELFIFGCPKFRCWGAVDEITEDGLTLPNLQQIKIEWCPDLETLPAWLPRLPLLKELAITVCPKVHSLPMGGLPSSLEMLRLRKCDPSLMKRCQREGSSLEWRMTRHIPQREIIFN